MIRPFWLLKPETNMNWFIMLCYTFPIPLSMRCPFHLSIQFHMQADKSITSFCLSFSYCHHNFGLWYFGIVLVCNLYLFLNRLAVHFHRRIWKKSQQKEKKKKKVKHDKSRKVSFDKVEMRFGHLFFSQYQSITMDH